MRDDTPANLAMFVGGVVTYLAITFLLEGMIFWGVVMFVIAMMIGGVAAH